MTSGHPGQDWSQRHPASQWPGIQTFYDCMRRHAAMQSAKSEYLSLAFDEAYAQVSAHRFAALGTLAPSSFFSLTKTNCSIINTSPFSLPLLEVGEEVRRLHLCLDELTVVLHKSHRSSFLGSTCQRKALRKLSTPFPSACILLAFNYDETLARASRISFWCQIYSCTWWTLYGDVSTMVAPVVLWTWWLEKRDAVEERRGSQALLRTVSQPVFS